MMLLRRFNSWFIDRESLNCAHVEGGLYLFRSAAQMIAKQLEYREKNRMNFFLSCVIEMPQMIVVHVQTCLAGFHDHACS
jgi:hypothetical protein